MKIPSELAPFAYELSKKVFEGKLASEEGKKQLVGDNRMNSNSAADYINNFRCMLEGKKFTRTLNAFSMEYFIENIYKDYGSIGLVNALNALRLCSTSIKKKDGTHYVEAAHIEPKNRKGRETPDNILLLCPNHHKEFDLGDRKILQHDKEIVKFVMNDKEYTISLKIE